MPERGYQLRFSGVLTFIRTSVRGYDGEGLEIRVSGQIVRFAPLARCHPHVALQNAAVRFARGNRALGSRRAPSPPMKLNGARPPVILLLARHKRFIYHDLVSALGFTQY
jgi:hypothetical protein